MKLKQVNGLTFSEAVDVQVTMNLILNLVEVLTNILISGKIPENEAIEAATNLVFSKRLDALNSHTPAQWLALGYSEKKALDATELLIIETFRDASKVTEEQKVILARVFSK
jgi:hypothetical protein